MQLFALLAVLQLALAAPAPATQRPGSLLFSGLGWLQDGSPFNGKLFQSTGSSSTTSKLSALPLLVGTNGKLNALNVPVNGQNQKLYFGLGPKLDSFDPSQLDTTSLCNRVTGLQIQNKDSILGRLGARGLEGLEERELEERTSGGLLGGLVGLTVGLVTGLLRVTVGLVVGLLALTFEIVASVLSLCFGLIGSVVGVLFGPIGTNVFPEGDWWPNGHSLDIQGGGDATYSGCYDDSYQIWNYNGGQYPIVAYNNAGQVQRFA